MPPGEAQIPQAPEVLGLLPWYLKEGPQVPEVDGMQLWCGHGTRSKAHARQWWHQTRSPAQAEKKTQTQAQAK